MSNEKKMYTFVGNLEEFEMLQRALVVYNESLSQAASEMKCVFQDETMAEKLNEKAHDAFTFRVCLKALIIEQDKLSNE